MYQVYDDSGLAHKLSHFVPHMWVCNNKSFLWAIIISSKLPGADLALEETGPTGICCPVPSCGSRSRKSSVLLPDGGRPKAGRGARAPVSNGKKSLKKRQSNAIYSISKVFSPGYIPKFCVLLVFRRYVLIIFLKVTPSFIKLHA